MTLGPKEVVFDFWRVLDYYFGTETIGGTEAVAMRKTAEKRPKKKVEASDELSPSSIIWDLGRAYYAYVGLLERVLVEQKLNHVLRPGMGVVLFSLFEKDRSSIKELAESSQLACSTLTGVLQKMEDSGLITRSRDPSDGRLVIITLTTLGRKLETKCREVAARMTEISERAVGLSNAGLCSEFLKGLTMAYRQEELRLSQSIKGRDAKCEGEKLI